MLRCRSGHLFGSHERDWLLPEVEFVVPVRGGPPHCSCLFCNTFPTLTNTRIPCHTRPVHYPPVLARHCICFTNCDNIIISAMLLAITNDPLGKHDFGTELSERFFTRKAIILQPLHPHLGFKREMPKLSNQRAKKLQERFFAIPDRECLRRKTGLLNCFTPSDPKFPAPIVLLNACSRTEFPPTDQHPRLLAPFV